MVAWAPQAEFCSHNVVSVLRARFEEVQQGASRVRTVMLPEGCVGSQGSGDRGRRRRSSRVVSYRIDQ